ncbi:MAG TPA: OmpA family protein [Nevskiaceae bacterium]|nr:OmpA family protein [Nevskiaceae bacterium]
MKHGSGLVGLLLALAVNMPAFAQDEGSSDSGAAPASPIDGKPWYVSPMFSYLLADKDRGTDDGYGGTITVGKRLTYGLNLELSGTYLQAKGKNQPGVIDNGTAKLSDVAVTALIFPMTTHPNFFGILSVGMSGAKNHPGTIAEYRGTEFDAGLGYLFPITKKILLRAEARYRLDQSNRHDAGVQVPPKNNSEFYEGLFNVGLLIPLGSVAAPPAAPPPEVATPPTNDSDGDGVPDDKDKCPGTPAGAIVDENGCEKDSDGDGVPDRLDKCPDTPAGQKVGADGCPLDSDGDGIPDDVDECPHTPAGAKVLANGCALTGDCRTPRPGEQVDENGCAVDKTFILKGVNFEFDSDRLTEPSKQILDQTAETLKSYPDIKVEVAGHTDNIGSDSYNLGLSERRAIAVKNYLTGRGVDAARMSPNGYGLTQPIDSNDSEAGRAKNRRVELRVIEQQNANVGK